MKILFLTENFPPETNAAATRVYERACYWAAWGHDVTVITCAPNFPHGKIFPGYRNSWRQTEKMSDIKVVRVKTYIAANQGVLRRTLDFVSFGVMGYFAGLKNPKPDIVAATSPQFFAAVAGWMIGASRRVPFVFELGDLWPASISAVGAMKKGWALGLVEKFELFLYRRAARVAALTRAFKDNLISRNIDGEKIDIVLNGVDLPRYSPRDRDKELASEWNLADMLAGAGAERERLVEEAARRKLENVVFLPPQPKENMPSVWSLCDVALVHLRNSPAFAEVIPSKIFEAMAMGLPILLTLPEGEAKSILDGHRAGLWTPPENPEALAAAIKKLAEEPELRKTLAAASLAAAPNHSRTKQAEEMIAVFEKALGRRAIK